MTFDLFHNHKLALIPLPNTMLCASTQATEMKNASHSQMIGVARLTTPCSNSTIRVTNTK